MFDALEAFVAELPKNVLWYDFFTGHNLPGGLAIALTWDSPCLAGSAEL